MTRYGMRGEPVPWTHSSFAPQSGSNTYQLTVLRPVASLPLGNQVGLQ